MTVKPSVVRAVVYRSGVHAAPRACPACSALPAAYPVRVVATVTVPVVPGTSWVTVRSPVGSMAALPESGSTLGVQVYAELPTKLVICTVKPNAVRVRVPASIAGCSFASRAVDVTVVAAST